MPQIGYSIGRDINVVIALPGGSILRLDKVTSFDTKQSSTEDRKKLLNGNTDTLRFFDGWTGTIKKERSGPEIDAYFSDLESNFYAGADEEPATMQVTITEPDGSTSQYRFQRVVLKYDEAGTWEGDKTVSQTLTFTAMRRI